MEKIHIALLIGLCAAIIDVTPMILQKLEKSANISAFIHWLVLGTIIPFVDWDIQPWLKGLIIGEMVSLPVMVLVFAKEKKAVIPIILFSAVLGMGVAIAGARFIG